MVTWWSWSNANSFHSRLLQSMHRVCYIVIFDKKKKNRQIKSTKNLIIIIIKVYRYLLIFHRITSQWVFAAVFVSAYKYRIVLYTWDIERSSCYLQWFSSTYTKYYNTDSICKYLCLCVRRCDRCYGFKISQQIDV